MLRLHILFYRERGLPLAEIARIHAVLRRQNAKLLAALDPDLWQQNYPTTR